MSASTRLGLALLSLAFLLGLLGDWLLRATPLGLGATLWLLAEIALAAGLARLRGRLHGSLALGLALAPVFALLLLWRDSTVLGELNVLGLGVCLSLGLIPGGRLRAARIDGLGHAFLLWLAVLAAGLFPVLHRDIRWRKDWRALLVALPVLALLVALAVIRFDPSAARIVAAVFWAWVGGGYLRFAATGSVAEHPSREPRAGGIGTARLAVVLGAVDLLFLIFVLVQRGTLLGDRSFVLHHANFTYADHARSGFFELAGATGLALGGLMALDRAVRREERGAELVYRLLGGCLVLVVLFVIGTALWRMRLYEQTFGLTGLRFYVAAFTVWVAAAVAWFAATMLWQRREVFATGLLASGLAALAVLNVIDPDALIARTDVHRARQQMSVDYVYLQTLSDDATPSLLAAVPELARIYRGVTPFFGPGGFGQPVTKLSPREIRRQLDLHASCSADWRTWNASRARARDLLCP